MIDRPRLMLTGLTALTLAAAAGCATRNTSPAATPAVAEAATPYLGGRARQVGERRYVGGQPGKADFAELKAAGITKVVNFRTPPEMDELGFDEPQILRDLGIEYINIPMGGDDYGYGPAQIQALASALDDPDEKVLLHCTVGWRASVATVAYLVNVEGMPLEQAMDHAQRWWPLQLEKMLGRKLKLEYADAAPTEAP